MVSRLAINAVVLLVVCASAAAAQTRTQHVSRQSLGIGAQWSFPPGSGTLSATPGVTLSWQGWYGPHLGAEAHLGRWHGETTWRAAAPGFETENTDAVTAHSIAFAVLGRIPRGRATFILGAGPGWFSDRNYSDSVQRSVTGERRFASADTYSSIGIHIVTEVDVRVTRSMSVFGGFNSQIRDVRYSESTASYPNAGVRWAF